jgi:uncharacterized membrane protein YfbV (UPF0208 family)
MLQKSNSCSLVWQVCELSRKFKWALPQLFSFSCLACSLCNATSRVAVCSALLVLQIVRMSCWWLSERSISSRRRGA